MNFMNFMNLFHALILGLIQGLGEFLPISSSAHLILAPWLFGFPDPGLTFDVALHLGTLIAIVLYFWKDFLEILATSLFSEKYKATNTPYSTNTLWLIIIATIPGAIAGLLLENYAETVFRNPLLIAGTLSIMGFILYLADKFTKETTSLKNISLKQSLLVGFSQAFAIIPGVSRSGSTITAGLFLGLDRISAARFSFLLSAPIIFGATIVKVPHLLKSGITSVEIMAILTAAVSGYIAIAWLLKFIEKVSYKIFFWYRLALALIIVLVWMLK